MVKDPVVKVDPPPPDPVVKVEPPKTEPVKVDPPKTDPVKPEVVKPKGRVITTEQLVARLKKIEGQLATKEAETGQKDNVLRQFVDQAKNAIEAANTDSSRKEAWSFLGDIEAQLKR